MAHEIYATETGKDSMAYAGLTPWHGLGQLLTEGADMDVWIREAGMAYRFEKGAVNYWDDNFESREFKDQYVIYRSDTKEPLSVVSNKYQIVQPREALEFFRDFAEAGDMTLETAGSLQNGRKFWALARINHGTNLNISEEDKINPYVLLASSCDKTMSTTAKLTTVRVVCNNTLSLALNNDNKSALKVPHSSKFDASKVKMQMGLVKESIEKHKNTFQTMHKTSMNMEEATKFFLNLLITPKERETGEIDTDKLSSKTRTLGKFVKSFEYAPGSENTVWGAVNAVTHAVDYNPTARTDESRLNSAWFATGEALKTESYQLAQNSDLLDSIITNTNIAMVPPKKPVNSGIDSILDMVSLG